MSQEKRECRICGEVKPFEAFEKDSRYEEIYTSRCKSCKLKSADKATQAFYKLKQRAAEAGEKVEVTLDEVKTLFAVMDGRCAYCGAHEDSEGKTFHLEHVIARSAGGRNHISNLTISCPTCNAKKQAKPVVAYFFDNREIIGDTRFVLLTHYIAVMSQQPVEYVVSDMVDQYADYEVRKIKAEMGG